MKLYCTVNAEVKSVFQKQNGVSNSVMRIRAMPKA